MQGAAVRLKERKLVGLVQDGGDLVLVPRALRAAAARAHLGEEGLPLLGLVALQAAQQQVLRARREVGLAREEAEALPHLRSRGRARSGEVGARSRERTRGGGRTTACSYSEGGLLA